MDAKEVRALRSQAYAVVLRRLRAEYPGEHQQLLALHADRENPTQAASVALRRRHPDRAGAMYREELLARGLAPGGPQPGRWPAGGA